MKGRKIFGGLAPYGEVWRAGANEATTFVTTTHLTVGGKDVAAGSYTIFIIPNPDKWTLIVSKKTNEWSIPYPGQGDDLVREDMNVVKLPSPVENFTIEYNQTGNNCELGISWENVRAFVEIVENSSPEAAPVPHIMSQVPGPPLLVPLPTNQVPGPPLLVPLPKNQVPGPPLVVPLPKNQVPGPPLPVPPPKS